MYFSNVQSTSIAIQINNEVIQESPEEKLLGVTLDKTLSFKAHVTSLYKKANQELHALPRIAHYTDSEKLKSVMKAFIIKIYKYIISMKKPYRLHTRMNFLTSRQP